MAEPVTEPVIEQHTVAEGMGATWAQHNQERLGRELERLRELLEGFSQSRRGRSRAGSKKPSKAKTSTGADQQPHPGAEPATSLDYLCAGFELSGFERDVLLLCAGVELDGPLAELVAEAQGGGSGRVTISLALAALPNAHWEAFSPGAPLRYWRLLHLQPGPGLTHSPLQIDEMPLHFLTGLDPHDDQLIEHMRFLPPRPAPAPSHQRLAERLVSAWRFSFDQHGLLAAAPTFELFGPDARSRHDVAAAVAHELRLAMDSMVVDEWLGSFSELESNLRAWRRLARLSPRMLLLELHGEFEGPGDGRARILRRALDELDALVVLSSRDRLPSGFRPQLAEAIAKPSAREQQVLWRQGLSAETREPGAESAFEVDETFERALEPALEALVSQFDLDAATIASVADSALGFFAAEQGRKTREDRERNRREDPADGAKALGRWLWRGCRSASRRGLDELAQRIDARSSWSELVLPEATLDKLRTIAAQVSQRYRVHEHWGMTGSGRGLGISALFHGASGTGKTMAAEVLANELELELYRIDLASVISKYIGETEKNLRRIFYAAESSGAILLFDEADALFGRRSEVKDSRDRHANVEISYLLQRVETYRGLSILTTNLRDALDAAFLRRLRFVVELPFPDREQRARLWQQVFPATTPVGRLDIDRLAALSLAGGNIRNISLNAAFLAASNGKRVAMKHVREAVRQEFAKLGRPLSAADLGERP